MRHNHTPARLCWALLALFPLTMGAMAAEPSPRELADLRPTVNAQRPGSVLVYNIYTSDATKPETQNTSITITNTNKQQLVALHLFAIRGSDGSVADAFICLTANQTTTILTSEFDPGSTGYLVIVAVDRRTGCPIGFNFLMGSEYVKFASGHTAALPAESIPALFTGALPNCQAGATTAKLNFDGVDYPEVPNTISVDKIPSPAEGNSTMVVFNSLGGALNIAGNSVARIGDFTGRLFDDSENSVGFTANAGYQFRSLLDDTFPTTTPRLSTFVPTGRTGWMRITAAEGRGITGAVLNFNPDTATKRTVFISGRNLPHLKTTSANLTIGLFPPSC
ncbi:MAG: hypothetical protein ABI977_04560 [Acidobacteriota bacterium]